MSLPIISAEERLREKHSAKICLVGIPGIGKTSQLHTLPAKSTLFVDLEAGDHKDYAAFMGVPSKVTPGGGASGAPAAVAPSFAGNAQVPQSRPATPAVAGKPSWAQ